MSSIRGNFQTLLGTTTQTTSGAQSPVLNLSALLGGEPDAAQFQLNAQTVSGTSPTLDVWLQWNDGTLWWDILHFTQVTTTGKQAALWSRRVSDGTAGTDIISTGDAVLAAGKVINAPIASSTFRAKWTIGGTSPSFAFSIQSVQDRD
jgi:hypothetical protein